MTIRTAVLPALTLVGLVAAGGCAASRDSMAAVDERLAFGDVEGAYHTLTAAIEADPTDTVLQQQLPAVRQLYLLKQGQEAVFADEDWKAVELFERVLVGDSDNPVARQWRDKALHKLAERETVAGEAELVQDHFEQAIAHFHQALSYVPGFEDAERGKRSVNERLARQRQLAQKSYTLGMRAQAEGQFRQTSYQMGIALANDPAMHQAEERGEAARRRLAEDRLLRARKAVDDGLYRAALADLRLVHEQFPDLDPELPTLIARMEREVQAGDLLAEATVCTARGEFAQARAKLEQAFELSTLRRVDIGDQLVALREAEVGRRYLEALDLELDYRYEQALAAFQAIEKATPGELDVRTRIGDLEAKLGYAREAIARAEEAAAKGEREAAVEAYREALLYLPHYGDLEQRIAALQAPATDGGAEGGDQPPPSGSGQNRP